MKKPLALIIMDGFGDRAEDYGNAIHAAKTPNLDRIFAENPRTDIGASGMDVGLPEGQMGNSEVGHTNIGAGRVVYQELTRITKAVKEQEIDRNEVLVGAMQSAKEKGTALHLMGLLSDGGVHSHQDHIYGLLELAKRQGLTKVYVHCFMDGRDPPPARTTSRPCWGRWSESAWAASPPSPAGTTPWTGITAGSGWKRPITPL